MVDIANAAMFRNGGASTATPDLLQRAFQAVVDVEERENDIVAFFHSDVNGTHTIQLTPSEAAALGLTFEVDPVGEVLDEGITLRTEQSGAIDEFRESLRSCDDAVENDKIDRIRLRDHTAAMITPEVIKMRRANAEVIKNNDEPMGTSVSMEEKKVWDEPSLQRNLSPPSQLKPSEESDKSTTITTMTTRTTTTTMEAMRCIGSSENTQRCEYEGKQMRHRQLGGVHNSRAQILHKLPIILPSSQFLVKPAQTVLKPTRNVRILPNTNKITNGAVHTVNAVHAINGNGQNSILLPKAALLNALSSKIINATPLTTQLLNANSIPAQLLNVSQVLSGSSENPGHVANTSQICSPVVGVNSGLVNSRIRLSPPVLKSVQSGASQRSTKHFLAPFIKNTTSLSVAKSIPALSGVSSKTPIGKPVQILTQSPHTTSATVASTIAKNSVASAAVFKASASTVKNKAVQDLRSAQQVATASVSILKPQSGYTMCNDRNAEVKPRNVAESISANALQNSGIGQNSASNQMGDFGTIKRIRNGTGSVILRHSDANVGEAATLVGKKPRNGSIEESGNAVAAEKTDTTKPLGSSENPIQIVQQGHTFHSMQRLSQSQLKQIAHVLQQRSQKAAMPNEKVVYRVVFPEELDLTIKNSGNSLKARSGKRGRPKKNSMRPTVVPPKPMVLPDEEREEYKDERRKVIARTRSGRLSRPPRHMLRDYKQLCNIESMEPDPDDSDGGFSDYVTNGGKRADEETPKELLTGLELPKRKISDRFRCPTCHKIYLGGTRMARHFEMHPHHGSIEQLPTADPVPELKQPTIQDPLKRKGKKRGPWAYVTPEAKSERRQAKLKEAISVCENPEIRRIAAKPVLNALSLFELLVIKSENNVRNFLDELKRLMDKVRVKAGVILTRVASEDIVSGGNEDVIDLSENLLCDVLGLDQGLYSMNNGMFDNCLKGSDTVPVEEPTLKRQRLDVAKEGKEKPDERVSNDFSDNTIPGVNGYLSERRTDSITNTNCPEVLTALTLMPRNLLPSAEADKAADEGISKLQVPSSEIRSQLPKTPGFVKLEPLERVLVKTEEDPADTRTFNKMQNGFDGTEGKGFRRIEPPRNHKIEITNSVSKIVPINATSDLSGALRITDCTESDSVSKMSRSLPVISGNCHSGIFGSTENLDLSKISNYDHITHLDILNTTGVVDKNLLMDEKLVEQLHLVDQSDLVDELVSERLKNIPDFSVQITNDTPCPMPDNILENNLISNNSNLDTDLDFEALSEEFNRNTRS